MGVVLTEQAGGNVILSLILTVVANIVGIFTVPPILGWLVDFDNVGGQDDAAAIQLDVGQLVLKLVYTLFIPICCGKFLNRYDRVKEFTKNYKFLLKVLLLSLPSRVR
jgi:predicted Na+-dependent transporter